MLEVVLTVGTRLSGLIERKSSDWGLRAAVSSLGPRPLLVGGSTLMASLHEREASRPPQWITLDTKP